MANDSGLNTSEVEEAMKNAGSEEERRYLERVLESRGVRKAVVSSHEIVAGNPDAYPAETVEQQKDLADGRPNEPVAAEDLNVRGSVPAGDKADEKAAKADEKAAKDADKDAKKSASTSSKK